MHCTWAFVQKRKTIADFVICCAERSSASDCKRWLATFSPFGCVPYKYKATRGQRLGIYHALIAQGLLIGVLTPWFSGNVENQHMQSLALLRSKQQITKSEIVFCLCTKACTLHIDIAFHPSLTPNTPLIHTLFTSSKWNMYIHTYFWLKYDREKWPWKNIFEIPPCARHFLLGSLHKLCLHLGVGRWSGKCLLMFT